MTPILATISEWHIILLLAVVFLLFGARKLPELARGMGQAIKEFKKAQREISAEDAAGTTAPPSPPPPPDAAKPASPLPKPADTK